MRLIFWGLIFGHQSHGKKEVLFHTLIGFSALRVDILHRSGSFFYASSLVCKFFNFFPL